MDASKRSHLIHGHGLTGDAADVRDAMARRRASKAGPLPIVVGVTGHRDLRPQDVEPLAESVQDVVSALLTRHPHSPVIILTPLAEGADRLVARVGLELGLRLIVPLPFAKERYEEDFEGPSLAEFRSLLARAEGWFELPFVEGCSAEGVAAGGPDRTEQYAAVGAFVAQHSHVLLALWDGGAGSFGGTGSIVDFRLRGAPTRFASATGGGSDAGAVHHVVTPRASNPDVVGTPYALRRLDPEQTQGAEGAVGEATIGRTDDFNREASELPSPASDAPATLAEREGCARTMLVAAWTSAEALARRAEAAPREQRGRLATAPDYRALADGLGAQREHLLEGGAVDPSAPSPPDAAPWVRAALRAGRLLALGSERR